MDIWRDDYDVNAQDALLVLRIVMGNYSPTTYEYYTADANHDDFVNSKDALEILKYSVGKSSGLYFYN